MQNGRISTGWLLWIFFFIAALSFTGFTAEFVRKKVGDGIIREGAEFDSSAYYENGEWMACCLDISNNKIRDYPTFYKIRDYLSTETNDIQTRYNFKYNIGTVTMTENFLPPKFPDMMPDPESDQSIDSVRISGQIPFLTLNFNYPAPLKGPRGDPGDDGPDGDRGPMGPAGTKGPPGYQSV